jgi:hypothetical protein
MASDDDPTIRRAVTGAGYDGKWRAEILEFVLPWFNHDAARARTWMREHTIPSFGATADKLIADGRGERVLQYLKRIDQGGYA